MPTLQTYRRAFAQLVGEYLQSTATANSSTTQLEDTAWPVYSATQQNDLYVDKFLYRPNAALAADKRRSILTYTPSQGLLIPDQPWTNAPSNGEAYELHWVFEPGTEVPFLINEALKRTLVVHEITVTPTANARRTRLNSTATWLTEPKWVRQMGRLDAGESREEIDPYEHHPIYGAANKIGEAVYFEHVGQNFDTSSTIYAKVLAPAYALCKPSGGSYGAQQGLSLDTDEAIPQTDWVAWGAVVEGWLRFGHVLESRVNDRMLRDQATAAAVFTKLTNNYLDVPPINTVPLDSWGPPSWGGRGRLNVIW